MYEIFKLIITIEVLKNFAFCQQYYPFPYALQNEDYAVKSFGTFFNGNAIQARNETSTTTTPPSLPPTSPPTSTPPPKPETTTETLIYIPIIQETIYESDFPPYYPPHPLFLNAPPEPGFQWNNLGDYSEVRELPPLIVPSRIQSLPILNVPQINDVPDRINYPVPSMIKPTPKPAPVLAQNQDTDAEITEAERDALAMELMKMINTYLAKKQQKLDKELESYTEKDHDQTDEDQVYDYKVIKPWSTSIPEISARPPNSLYAPSKVPDSAIKTNTNKTSNESAYNISQHRIGEQNEINKTSGNQLISNSSSDYKGLEKTDETTQITFETNQSKGTTDIDETRKLDFDTGEGETTDKESITDTSTDKLSPNFSKDLVKSLGNNLTSSNGSKWNDRFKGDSTVEPKIREFVDSKGNKCTEELVHLKDKAYTLITCEEKSFDGSVEANRKTTYKSDVTYFTVELTTEPSSSMRSDTVIDSETVTESQPEKVVDNDNLTSVSESYLETTTVDPID